jgi:hypothetical protein
MEGCQGITQQHEHGNGKSPAIYVPHFELSDYDLPSPPDTELPPDEDAGQSFDVSPDELRTSHSSRDVQGGGGDLPFGLDIQDQGTEYVASHNGGVISSESTGR